MKQRDSRELPIIIRFTLLYHNVVLMQTTKGSMKGAGNLYTTPLVFATPPTGP